jgi:competence protein ComEC
MSQDLRLVPSAVAVWLCTLLGLLVHWSVALAGGLVAGAVGVAALVAARGVLEQPVQWAWRGMGASLLSCGLVVASLTTLRLVAAADDPLRPPAARGANGQFRVELDDRPRPVFSAGFGGRPGGAQAVVVPAQVRRAVVAGHPVTSSGQVLVIAPADGWSRLLPGQEVDVDAALEVVKPGGMAVAVLRVRGPPAAVSAPAAWQRWAQTLRAGLRQASNVLGPEPAGLLPALVVGDADALPRNVVEEFQVAGMAHLLAVSGANRASTCVA